MITVQITGCLEFSSLKDVTVSVMCCSELQNGFVSGNAMCPEGSEGEERLLRQCHYQNMDRHFCKGNIIGFTDVKLGLQCVT